MSPVWQLALPANCRTASSGHSHHQALRRRCRCWPPRSKAMATVQKRLKQVHSTPGGRSQGPFCAGNLHDQVQLRCELLERTKRGSMRNHQFLSYGVTGKRDQYTESQTQRNRNLKSHRSTSRVRLRMPSAVTDRFHSSVNTFVVL